MVLGPVVAHTSHSLSYFFHVIPLYLPLYLPVSSVLLSMIHDFLLERQL